MADGAVSYFDPKQVQKIRLIEKKREILNPINKTRTEAFPDLMEERLQRDREVNAIRKKKLKMKMEEEKQELAKLRAEKEARDYSSIFDEDAMKTNSEANDDDDFM